MGYERCLKDITKEELRVNLPILRAFAGWSSEDMAQLLGITRQTFIKIENHPDYMSTLQFLAIKAVLYGEIEYGPNPVLGMAVMVLKGDNDTQRAEFIKDVNAIKKRLGHVAGCYELKRQLNEWVLGTRYGTHF